MEAGDSQGRKTEDKTLWHQEDFFSPWHIKCRGFKHDIHLCSWCGNKVTAQLLPLKSLPQSPLFFLFSQKEERSTQNHCVCVCLPFGTKDTCGHILTCTFAPLWLRRCHGLEFGCRTQHTCLVLGDGQAAPSVCSTETTNQDAWNVIQVKSYLPMENWSTFSFFHCLSFSFLLICVTLFCRHEAAVGECETLTILKQRCQSRATSRWKTRNAPFDSRLLITQVAFGAADMNVANSADADSNKWSLDRDIIMRCSAGELAMKEQWP